jgi:arylsulfatase A-like enzyme
MGGVDTLDVDKKPPGVIRAVRAAVRWMVFGVVAVLLVAVGFVAGRVLLYRQADDAVRLENKRVYLTRVADLAGKARRGPNLVFILFDDLGVGDLGVYGGTAIATPNLDRLAAEGMLFEDAYSPSPYCSASRAGWLTGRYATRSGLDHVLQVEGSWQDTAIRFGGLNRRLPAEEITLAEVLQAAGYTTAIVGKWHLGGESPSLPTDMGFDSFYGLLYSNDQGEPVVWSDREIVEPHPIDQSTLTQRYTEKAVEFIESHRNDRFFLYLAHTFPHRPLHAAGDRLGRSAAGLYGDVVEELDWSTGQVLDALRITGVSQNTLVVVSSDNGPWFQGSPGALRGRKFDVFEGGMRTPLIVRWPERVRRGRIDDGIAVGVDLFPTVLAAARLPLPIDRVIDGENLLDRFAGRPEAPHGPVWFSQVGHLRAVRDGRFKYHDRHTLPFGNPPDFRIAFQVPMGPWLFDLSRDPNESYDASVRYPEEVERLEVLLDARRHELEENPRGWR